MAVILVKIHYYVDNVDKWHQLFTVFATDKQLSFTLKFGSLCLRSCSWPAFIAHAGVRLNHFSTHSEFSVSVVHCTLSYNAQLCTQSKNYMHSKASTCIANVHVRISNPG